MNICTTDSDFKKVIQRDSVLEMTHTTKHELPAKYSTMLSEWGNNIYTDLSNYKISPNDCDT